MAPDLEVKAGATLECWLLGILQDAFLVVLLLIPVELIGLVAVALLPPFIVNCLPLLIDLLGGALPFSLAPSGAVLLVLILGATSRPVNALVEVGERGEVGERAPLRVGIELLLLPLRTALPPPDTDDDDPVTLSLQPLALAWRVAPTRLLEHLLLCKNEDWLLLESKLLAGLCSLATAPLASPLVEGWGGGTEEGWGGADEE